MQNSLNFEADALQQQKTRLSGNIEKIVLSLHVILSYMHFPAWRVFVSLANNAKSPLHIHL